jgi:AcrR family transcriptional regulator
VFSQRGYDAATMDDIADFAGLSRPALYHHAPSKQELLRLALEPLLSALESIRLQQQAPHGPAITRLEAVVHQMIKILTAQAPCVTLLLHLRGNTDVERAAVSRRDAIDNQLAELVYEAWNENSIRSEVEPFTAARLLIGMINSTADGYRPSNGPTPQHMADEILRLALHGMRSSH